MGGKEGTTPHLAQELLVFAALEDTSAAVEAERCRLAGLLQDSIVEPINLLLSQANAYEQTLGANPTARMAVSVRDLEDSLHPSVLETLGLEPAGDDGDLGQPIHSAAAPAPADGLGH
jgi:hypothetical protein